jgi:hypothetical protein
MTHTPQGAPAPASSTPRRRSRIEPTPLSDVERASRRTRRIRILRAVAMIGRSKVGVAVACRVVGLHDDWRATEDVRGLLDVRQIPRRRKWGTPLAVPHTQEPVPEIVLPCVPTSRRRCANINLFVRTNKSKANAPKPPVICACTVCGTSFESKRKSRYCGGACRIAHWRAEQ